MTRGRIIPWAAVVLVAVLTLPGCFPKRARVYGPENPPPDSGQTLASPTPSVQGDVETGEPVFYVVRKGDNLYQISKKFGLTVQQIARANKLRDPRKLGVGQKLVIPGLTRDPSDRQMASSLDQAPLASGSGDGSWSWPLLGKISSGFGPRGRRHHSGIDILGPSGTSIRATQDGTVTFAARRGRFGQLVILQHGDGFTSFYGHNRKILVKPGQTVKRGDVIAEVGRTGNASASHLHFEIRHDGRPLNPLALLPGEATAHLQNPVSKKGES